MVLLQEPVVRHTLLHATPTRLADGTPNRVLGRQLGEKELKEATITSLRLSQK